MERGSIKRDVFYNKFNSMCLHCAIIIEHEQGRPWLIAASKKIKKIKYRLIKIAKKKRTSFNGMVGLSETCMYVRYCRNTLKAFFVAPSIAFSIKVILNDEWIISGVWSSVGPFLTKPKIKSILFYCIIFMKIKNVPSEFQTEYLLSTSTSTHYYFGNEKKHSWKGKGKKVFQKNKLNNQCHGHFGNRNGRRR